MGAYKRYREFGGKEQREEPRVCEVLLYFYIQKDIENVVSQPKSVMGTLAYCQIQ